MKNLDKTKKYDLRQLNDEQLQAVLDWLKDNDKDWENKSIGVFKPSYLSHSLAFFDPDFKIFGDIDETCTNALELFNDEETSIYDDILSLIEKGKQQGLKIVVTFEKL